MHSHPILAAFAGGMTGGIMMFLGWSWAISRQLARAERVNGFGE